MTTVALVDDDELVCRYLRTILEASPDLKVVGQAHDADEGVAMVRRTRPDVVLLDVRMPGRGGLDVLADLVSLPHRPRVVALTAYADERSVLRALGGGASGFLVKSTPPQDVVALVQLVSRGHQVLSEVVAGWVATDAARAGDRRLLADRIRGALTPREQDVLRRIGLGESNAELAAVLGLTELTVRGYVSTVLAKLGCTSRLQAGLLALRAGLAD